MRPLLLLLAALLSFDLVAQVPPLPVPNRVAKIALAWDASPSPEVRGYRLYHATNGQNYSSFYSVPGRTNTTYTVTNAPPGASNSFVVTAVNADGIESDPSNTATKVVQPVPAPPGPLQVLPVILTVRWKPPAAPWADLITTTNLVLVDVAVHPAAQFSARVALGPPVQLVRPR